LYIGYVGFGMGVVLLVCFLMSAIMSPILWSWFGKRAVSGADPERTPAIVSAESIRRASS
jgi:hypothetical protein